jgi:hypothetical protein
MPKSRTPVPRATWSILLDRIIVAVLMAEKAAGKQAQSGWKKATIEAVRLALIEEGATRTIQQITDRIGRVRPHRRAISQIIDAHLHFV